MKKIRGDKNPSSGGYDTDDGLTSITPFKTLAKAYEAALPATNGLSNLSEPGPVTLDPGTISSVS
jgi:hypothetical protein